MLFKNPVRTSKRTPHFTITSIDFLTLFKEIIAVYSENHAKSINTKFSITVKADGSYSYRSALKGNTGQKAVSSDRDISCLAWKR
jgi:hypothetical protein